MAHLAALEVADAMSEVPFVVDMRDPWSLVERVPSELDSPLWHAWARRHEVAVLRKASIVAMNTEAARDAMTLAYPNLAERIHVIRNGTDDEEFARAADDGIFRIRFAGSVYLDRDPRLFFRAAAQVIAALRLTPSRFTIEFVGDSDPNARTPAFEIASQEGVAEFVSFGSVLPRQQTLEFLAGATMLLSLPQDSNLAVPAKIYEYVAMNAWLLVLANPASATARVLAGTEASVVEPSDVDAMAAVIRKRVEQYLGGERPQPAGKGGQFARRLQSDKLIGLIEGEIRARVTGGVNHQAVIENS